MSQRCLIYSSPKSPIASSRISTVTSIRVPVPSMSARRECDRVSSSPSFFFLLARGKFAPPRISASATRGRSRARVTRACALGALAVTRDVGTCDPFKVSPVCAQLPRRAAQSVPRGRLPPPSHLRDPPGGPVGYVAAFRPRRDRPAVKSEYSERFGPPRPPPLRPPPSSSSSLSRRALVGDRLSEI